MCFMKLKIWSIFLRSHYPQWVCSIPLCKWVCKSFSWEFMKAGQTFIRACICCVLHWTGCGRVERDIMNEQYNSFCKCDQSAHADAGAESVLTFFRSFPRSYNDPSSSCPQRSSLTTTNHGWYTHASKHPSAHTYCMKPTLLSWCLCTLPGAHIPSICIEIGNWVSNSIIPWASTVPHDPTPQCPPTHIYKNRTIFSWIPLCAWHLLLLLLHILCTKGCAYTCSLAHTWLNSLVHTQSHVSGARGFMLSLGGTQWHLRCCMSLFLATSL